MSLIIFHKLIDYRAIPFICCPQSIFENGYKIRAVELRGVVVYHSFENASCDVATFIVILHICSRKWDMITRYKNDIHTINNISENPITSQYVLCWTYRVVKNPKKLHITVNVQIHTIARNPRTTFPKAPGPTILIIVVSSKTAEHNPSFVHLSLGMMPFAPSGRRIPPGPILKRKHYCQKYIFVKPIHCQLHFY